MQHSRKLARRGGGNEAPQFARLTLERCHGLRDRDDWRADLVCPDINCAILDPPLAIGTVSYTPLTLPTIYSV